jgi:uncharacterized RDD family membrane protein YckC
MTQYYIVKNEKQNGPYSLNEIVEMNLPEDTLIWAKGLSDWIQIKNLDEYKAYLPPPVTASKKAVFPENHFGVQTLKNEQLSYENNSQISNLNSSEYPQENAGFWLRLLAFLIDFTIMFSLTSFIWAVFQLPVPLKSQYFAIDNFIVFRNPLGFICGWFYLAIFESSSFQASPGKVIVGLVVTNSRYNKIGFGQASGRFFGKILSGLIIGIGYLMIGFTKNKQGLHDQLAHTFVLKRKEKFGNRKTISIVILGISILLFIASVIIPTNSKLIDNLYSSISSDSNSKPVEEIIKSQTYSFDGISFEYPSNYKVEKEELQKDLAYQINIEKKAMNSSEIISITWLNMKLDNREMIQNTIAGIKDQPTHKNANVNSIIQTNYKGFKSLSADFNVIIMNEKYYGKILSFNTKNKTILILKQTDEINKLDTEFITIESSIHFE